MNLVLSMLVIGMSAATVWGGITDPEGGLFAGLARGLRGEDQTKRSSATGAAFVANLATLTGTSSTGTGSAAPARHGGRAGGGDPSPYSGGMGQGKYNLGAVKPHVRKAAEEVGVLFAIGTVYGVGSRSTPNSDHPKGLALDFMTSDNLLGTALAKYVLANRKRLGVTYVIWRQRINSGTGWRAMEDRGSKTANHFDHVHVSFRSSSGGAST